MGCKMPLKIVFWTHMLTIFPTEVGVVNVTHGKRFYQKKSTVENQRWGSIFLVSYRS
jgi:hypothetical protein